MAGEIDGQTPHTTLGEPLVARSETERLLADIADAAPGAVIRFYLKPDGLVGFSYVSRGIEEIDGLSAEEVVRNPKSAFQYVLPEDFERLRTATRVSAEKLERLLVEFRIRGVSGRVHWIRFSAMPRREPCGTIIWNGIATDVTELKTTEEKLRESEQRCRTLLEGSFSGLCIHSGGAILDANQGFCQITGYSYEELIGMNPLELIAPECRQYAAEMVQSQSVNLYESIGVRKGGARFPVEIQAKNIQYRGTWARVVEVRDISERRRAEQDLRQKEALYHTLFECAGDAILILKDGRFTNCNTKATELFALPRESIVGRTPGELSPPLQPDGEGSEAKAHRLMSQALEGASLQFEWRHIRGVNEEFDAEVTLVSIPASGAGILQAVVRDVTERKRALEQLRRRVEWEALLSSISSRFIRPPSPSFSLNVDWALGEIGRQLRADVVAIGLLSEDKQSVFFPNGWVADRVAGSLRIPERLYVKEHSAVLEPVIEGRIVIFPDPSGQIRPGDPIQPCDWRPPSFLKIPLASLGRVIGYLAVGSQEAERRWDELELTILKNAAQIFTTAFERRMADLALKASERKYRELVQNANSIILRVTVDGQVAFINRFGLEFFGYEPDEILGRKLADTIFPADDTGSENARRLIGMALQDSAAASTLETVNVRRNGDRVNVAWTSCAAPGPEEEPAQILCIGNDITEVRRLEQQFLQAQKMEAVGRLAGGIAHDFNNLLTVINGYDELSLRCLEKAEPLYKNLEEIRKAGGRAAALTQQLLAFSRKQVAKPEPINLNDIVTDFVGMVRSLVGENIQLHTRLGAHIPLVHADANQIHQVLMNLVVNARDAMPRGGELTIATWGLSIEEVEAATWGLPPGNYAVLSVSDTGQGISEPSIPFIFDPFFTTKAPGSGTGLGLATVDSIVRQHGGQIRVETQEGKGTTFRVFLPATVPEASRSESVGDSPSLELVREEGIVLIVEDQPQVRRLLRDVLRSYGYCVLEASGGAEALRLAASRGDTIDVLLTDLVMPGMSGHELANKFLESHPETRVVIMSGYAAEPSVGYELVSKGAVFLAKPFTPWELGETIRRVARKEVRTAVLVVDDEAAVRAYMRNVLEGAGYEVLEAGNGRDAIEVANTARLRLVVTDLVMPEKEGLETIRELHKRHPEIRIVAVSGAFGGQYVEIASRLGAKVTLVKPFTPEDLLRAVRQALA